MDVTKEQTLAALADLVEQLRRGGFVEEHGHKATMLQAYINAKSLVERAEALPPPPEPFEGQWEKFEEGEEMPSDE